MRILVFGLTITSSWGNGHATLWRALCRALVRRGHHVTFYERDVDYYASTRDLQPMPGVEPMLYRDWAEIRPQAERALRGADLAMVTSYCPDGIAASALVLESGARLRAFYDLDTPVTLDRLAAGERPAYLPPDGLGGFDIVLSYTGGEALTRLRTELGARRVAPLYGSVDPEAHHPVAPDPRLQADLSYLGTYAADRQPALERLFVAPARRLPARRFVIGGALYPQDFPWADNIWFVRHMPPPDHPAFFSSSRLTLNVTRRAMADMGWCPSGRLFEAAACGAAILTDTWPGLSDFYAPGRELLAAETTEEAIAAIGLSDAELRRIAQAARERTLAEHTADHRALALEAALAAATTGG
ncbi:CgeB family protein [Paracraurococcus lichenis]|uniref:Glycosyltransferase n=1 Tax=Paracraurococcus lichenis TaxID=3064888 RepID=A0ABT9E7Z4_9PROT|nr:glycosyltransferase [Paracraurococcus sp. LOR1-02]MDO9712331.1 glycosyltransferase [Paracraurococcus sp. LOR1-02]